MHHSRRNLKGRRLGCVKRESKLQVLEIEMVLMMDMEEELMLAPASLIQICRGAIRRYKRQRIRGREGGKRERECVCLSELVVSALHV